MRCDTLSHVPNVLPVALIGDHNFIDEDVMKRNQFARGRRRRAIALATAPLIAASLLSGCGSQGGPPTLTWYILPDNGGSVARAEQCAEASNGAYQVRIESLPSTATAQREQMVRRLAAGDAV